MTGQPSGHGTSGSPFGPPPVAPPAPVFEVPRTPFGPPPPRPPSPLPPGHHQHPQPGERPYAPPQYLFRPQIRPNGFCVASLALGVVGMACFVLYAVPCVLAIVFGVIGTNQVKRSDGAESGAGLGVAGIVLGITGLCLLAFVLAVYAGSWDITRIG